VTTLVAIAGFALLFAVTGLVPLRGEEGGCGGDCHGCVGGSDCEFDAGPARAGRGGWKDE
jgi:hypothetical protein